MIKHLRKKNNKDKKENIKSVHIYGRIVCV